jgi:pimeloyl-ACP methyl ester carboxylesterase
MNTRFQAEGLSLSAHLARPPGGGGTNGLVLCHGFPSGPRGAATAGQTYPEFAERVAAELGWVVLTFNFRGTGASDGQFSLGGWLTDLRAAVDTLLSIDGVTDVWLAGFGEGGSLAICTAGEDERVQGVAAFAAPSEFEEWASDPERFLAHAREIGVIRDAAFPLDREGWVRELREIKPLALIGKVPPRPLLLVHGDVDAVVVPAHVRELADAAEGYADVRLLNGAGHRLRHDPRAVAALLGWLTRQGAA